MSRQLLASVALALGMVSGARAQEPVDRAMIARIRDEAQARSQVAATFNHITNVTGPRLTGSPAFKQAVDWATEQLKGYGLSAVHQESWPFGRGWGLQKLELEMVEPFYFPLIGFAEAWSPSTKGELFGTPVYIGDLADSTAVRARAAELKGAIVLATGPQNEFITKDRLEPSLSDAPVPIGAPPFLNAGGPLPNQLRARVMREVGAGLVLRPTQGQHGTMFVLGNRATPDDAAPSVIVAAEQYNMIVNAIKAGSAVKLRARVDTRFYSAPTPTATTSSPRFPAPTPRSRTRWSCSARTSIPGTPRPAPPTTPTPPPR